MNRVLDTRFFRRSAPIVASALLGTFLVRRTDGGHITAHMITETEAYDGFDDRASHAFRGRTPRNAPMFGPSGYWYVYLIYGMHHMLNVVTGHQGYPSAVLIRAVEGIRGPGRITRCLHITRALNACRAAESTGLWIEDRGVKIHSASIEQTARIGVEYAGEWAQKQWRFVLRDHPHEHFSINA